MNKGVLWGCGGVIILSAKPELQKTLTCRQNVPIILQQKSFFILAAPQKFHPQAMQAFVSSSYGALTSTLANFNIEKLYKIYYFMFIF